MNQLDPTSALMARQVLQEQNSRLKQRLAELAKTLASADPAKNKKLDTQIQHFKESIAIGKKMLEKGFKQDPKGGELSFSLLQQLRQEKDSLLKIKANQESALVKYRIHQELKAKIREIRQSHKKLKLENKILQENLLTNQSDFTEKKLEESYLQVEKLRAQK